MATRNPTAWATDSHPSKLDAGCSLSPMSCDLTTELSFNLLICCSSRISVCRSPWVVTCSCWAHHLPMRFGVPGPQWWSPSSTSTFCFPRKHQSSPTPRCSSSILFSQSKSIPTWRRRRKKRMGSNNMHSFSFRKMMCNHLQCKPLSNHPPHAHHLLR